MPKTNPPALTAESSPHARKIADHLHARLVAMSQQIAWANRHDNIQCSDVNKALLTLKRAGLEEPPKWYKRPNFFITLGAILVGLAPSVASISYTLIDRTKDFNWFAFFVLAAPSFIGGAGATMAVFGWMSDND